jgi:hypothetical protein
MPMSPTWKLLKSTSMSWQHRWMALSASSDVAGTWKCFSAASSSALGSSIAPLQRPTTPIVPEVQEVPKHTGGQKPLVCFLSFKAPQHQEGVWNEQTQPQTPPHHRKLAQKCKNAAGIVGMRFGASWRRRR